MKYTPAIPKTVGVREVQREYRAVHKQLQTDDMLLVMNQGKPDMVLLSLKEYQDLKKKEEEWEIQDTLKAIEEYKADKKAGKLKSFESLKELIKSK